MQNDIFKGYTHEGIHRDDFEIYLGNDNQLNKAVEYLLKEIEKYPALPGVPEAPVRVRKK